MILDSACDYFLLTALRVPAALEASIMTTASIDDTLGVSGVGLQSTLGPDETLREMMLACPWSVVNPPPVKIKRREAECCATFNKTYSSSFD